MSQVRSSARQRKAPGPEVSLALTPGKPVTSKMAHTKRTQDENVGPSNCREEEDPCFKTPGKRLKASLSSPLKRVDVNVSIAPKQDDFELVVESSPRKEADVLDSFSEARKLFHRATKTRIIGRSQERSTVETWWHESVTSHSAKKRILYICGTPGTGKSALLTEMIPGLCSNEKVSVIERNCMMFEEATDILFELNMEILQKGHSYTKAQCAKKRDTVCRAIQSALMARKGKTVLILDELDQLAMADLSLLSAIFNWTTEPKCNLSIIGIANSIDLTARYVPESLQPLTDTLYFAPYNVEDITAILTDRMNRANKIYSHDPSTVLIQPVAVELCSRKVAAIGDLRKALEIMQMAFDVAGLDPNCRQIQFAHVLKAMEKALPSCRQQAPGKSINNTVDQLNVNARMVLVSLLLFQDENPAPVGTRLPYKKPTIQLIYDRYVSLLRTSAGKAGTLMDPVSRDEFLVLLADLETFGLVHLTKPGPSQAQRRKSFSNPQDWQSSVIKLNVSDRQALVETLRTSSITRLFFL